MNWHNKKIFVTGGNGFLGSWLVKRLIAEGAEVSCLIYEDLPASVYSREKLDKHVCIIPGRLEDAELLHRTLRTGKFDAVFHLAAQAIVGIANRDPAPTFGANILGTWNLLEACRLNPVAAIVVASSDKAYGDSSNLPYREDHPLRGIHPYDVSKSCADLIAGAYHATYQLPVTVTRCGNIIGGGDSNWNRIVPGTIQSLLRGERPIVRSDGLFVRDYVYVEDIVDAYLVIGTAAGAGKFHGEAWNVSNDQPVNVLQVVDALRKICRREDLLPDIRNEASHEIREQYLDSSKIRRHLGWKPGHDLAAALRKSVEWYRANGV
ncbi:MAG: CDP-glucose 4,6-dehydratase [Verrucomicrobiae bacterium]|nr:CDP-glucose 4,6-dehydratase [Verrucomicrobiae bacterium]